MKEFIPQEPMELVAMGVPATDDAFMAECLVEEYLLMGWNERQLMGLFSRPFFGATHRIYRERGEEYVRALIQRVGAAWQRQPEEGDAHA